jgi:hypothetical protein
MKANLFAVTLIFGVTASLLSIASSIQAATVATVKSTFAKDSLNLGNQLNSVLSKSLQASIPEQIKFLNGTWDGTYTCNQGLTSLRLVIEARNANEIDAVFIFSPHSSNPSVPSGSFKMKGTYKTFSSPDIPSILTLQGNTWINRPNGYVTVDLSGNVLSSEKKIAGNVNTSGCSTFEVTKVEKQ